MGAKRKRTNYILNILRKETASQVIIHTHTHTHTHTFHILMTVTAGIPYDYTWHKENNIQNDSMNTITYWKVSASPSP
jgi:hypothetical protein